MFLKQGNVKNTSSHVDPEKQWREKLLGECQEEFFETFGQYDGKFEHPALYYWLYLCNSVLFHAIESIVK